MAGSKFVWLVVYGDLSNEYVRAQNVYQIINCPELSQSTDNIIQINRIELASFDNEKGILDIPFQD